MMRQSSEKVPLDLLGILGLEAPYLHKVDDVVISLHFRRFPSDVVTVFFVAVNEQKHDPESI